MSDYSRNNTMVGCIIAVIIIGAALVGIVAYYGAFGGVHFNGGEWDSTTTFTFQNTDPNPPSTMGVDINLDVGIVNVTFTDDPTLIAKVEVEVPNVTLAKYGEPVVTFSGASITLNYKAAKVIVTLGNVSGYTFDLSAITGSVNVTANASAHIGETNLQVATGTITFTLDGAANIVGNASVTTTVTSGAIIFDVTKPTGIGMHFTGDVTTGDVDVTTTTWAMVSQNVYQTGDYETAAQLVSLTASVTTGSVNALLK